jgi:hypothetical protein
MYEAMEQAVAPENVQKALQAVVATTTPQALMDAGAELEKHLEAHREDPGSCWRDLRSHTRQASGNPCRAGVYELGIPRFWTADPAVVAAGDDTDL